MTGAAGKVLDRHEPGEAAGGFIECSCGWPTRDQFEAGERFTVHVVRALANDEGFRVALAHELMRTDVRTALLKAVA